MLTAVRELAAVLLWYLRPIRLECSVKQCVQIHRPPQRGDFGRKCIGAARGGLLALVCMFAALPSGFTIAAEYHVGPHDRLRIKVSEWRPTTRELFEWSTLSGEFTVSPAGMLSLPVIGAFSVETMTMADIAATISDRLKVAAGLVSAPATAVEMAQYRPIYVVGAVERPGEYAYRPAMTALHAVSIAGGYQRAEMALGRFERETIVAEGEIRVQQSQLVSLLLRRDRLQAEARQADDIRFASEIERYSGDGAADAMREERALFTSRRKAIVSRIELLRESRRMLDEELKTLGAKEITQKRQQDLIQRELDNINSLIRRGLTVNPRQLAVEQNLAQSESQALDLILATARTKQEISRLEASILEVSNEREIDIARELRETQLSLKQTVDRINSLRALIYESSAVAPALQTEQERALARMRFSILRQDGEAVQEIQIEESSTIQPGDVVKIERAGLRSIAARPPTSASPGIQN
ncbi:capsule polysaccharide export protein [Bosea sp. BIWAKO-01]|nr:capsule polysaccharide export protein [Bosea sp. BIWAKO-01]